MTDALGAALLWLRGALFDNLGMKAVALLFSLGLYAYLHSQEATVQRTVPVGIVLRVPAKAAHRELMTSIPPTVQVSLRGPAGALDRLVQRGLPPIEVDLRDGRAEEVKFDTEQFELPPLVEVTFVDPPSLSLQWEDVITRKLPVQPTLAGTPVQGYEVVGQPRVDPTDVVVQGPRSEVEVMQHARLAPFDVSSKSEGVHRQLLAIDAPPQRVTYLNARAATVIVEIARRKRESNFVQRPVQVVGLAKATTVPATVDVRVIGPPDVVSALRADQMVPRVDVSSFLVDESGKERKHGSAQVEVVVDISDATVTIQPPTVTVKW